MIELNVFDENFNRKTIINTYISLIWEEEYQDKGGFVLVMDDMSSGIVDVGDMLFMRDNPYNTAMIVLNKEINSETRQCMVTGYTTLYFISKRILRNIIRINNAEAGMYQMLIQNMRGHTRISTAPLKGYTEVLESERSWVEVLQGVSEVAIATGLGIRMGFDHEAGLHVFEVIRGLDRRVTQNVNQYAFFADEFKNIYGMKIADDQSVFKNVAYVAGEGEGAARAVVEVGTAQGNDRFELYVDARDLQPTETETNASPAYLNRLRNRGVQKLAEHVRRTNFEINVDSLEYGVRYNLGDQVSCKSTQYDIMIHARIMKHTYTMENNMLTTKLTVGDAKLDAIGAIMIWQN